MGYNRIEDEDYYYNKEELARREAKELALKALTPTEMLQYLMYEAPTGAMTISEIEYIKEKKRDGVHYPIQKDKILKIYRRVKGI